MYVLNGVYMLEIFIYIIYGWYLDCNYLEVNFYDIFLIILNMVFFFKFYFFERKESVFVKVINKILVGELDYFIVYLNDFLNVVKLVKVMCVLSFLKWNYVSFKY